VGGSARFATSNPRVLEVPGCQWAIARCRMGFEILDSLPSKAEPPVIWGNIEIDGLHLRIRLFWIMVCYFLRGIVGVSEEQAARSRPSSLSKTLPLGDPTKLWTLPMCFSRSCVTMIQTVVETPAYRVLMDLHLRTTIHATASLPISTFACKQNIRLRVWYRLSMTYQQ
jgi:hypothetical protein